MSSFYWSGQPLIVLVRSNSGQEEVQRCYLRCFEFSPPRPSRPLGVSPQTREYQAECCPKVCRSDMCQSACVAVAFRREQSRPTRVPWGRRGPHSIKIWRSCWINQQVLIAESPFNVSKNGKIIKYQTLVFFCCCKNFLLYLSLREILQFCQRWDAKCTDRNRGEFVKGWAMLCWRPRNVWTCHFYSIFCSDCTKPQLDLVMWMILMEM